MKALFADLLKIDEVEGVLLLSIDGQPIFNSFSSLPAPVLSLVNWPGFIRSLNEVREADMIFETGRLYLRRTDSGYLLVVMEPFAPSARVRLNCDVLVPALKNLKIPRKTA